MDQLIKPGLTAHEGTVCVITDNCEPRSVVIGHDINGDRAELRGYQRISQDNLGKIRKLRTC